MALKSVRIIREVLAQSEIAKFIKVERLPGPSAKSDEEIMSYIRQYACCDYHPVGTCKMGVDEMSVVDPQLRLRGIERLRVIDSSIMPVLISGNTNGPTMMIGEKGADLIRGVRSARSHPAMAAVA
jgi:choline dehydrogenase-like flavoprotein